MRRRPYLWLTLGIALCLAPVGGVIWSSWFAKRHGCTLHEGFANPCIVDGTDWGETLYTAFVSGWFMLVTLPVAGLLALALAGLVIRDIWRRLRR